MPMSPDPVPSRRDRLRAATKAEIVETARKLLVAEGLAGVTLRAIGRDMGMTAPALYRYYASLDTLLESLCASLFEECTAFIESRMATGEGLPGVFFREAYFQPTFHKFMGQLCNGAQFHVTDRGSFLPWWTTLSILNLLREDYGEHFRWKEPPYEYEHARLPIEILIGGPLGSVFPEIIPG